MNIFKKQSIKAEKPESEPDKNNQHLISNTASGPESGNNQFRFSSMKSESKSSINNQFRNANSEFNAGYDNPARSSNTMSGSSGNTIIAEPVVSPKIEYYDETDDTFENDRRGTKPKKEKNDPLKYKAKFQKYKAMARNTELQLKDKVLKISELEKLINYASIQSALQQATEIYFNKNVTMKAFCNPIFTTGPNDFSSYEAYIKELHFPLVFADACSTNNFTSVYCNNTLAVIGYFYPYCTAEEEIILSQDKKPMYSKLTLTNSCTNSVQVYYDGYFSSNNAGIGGTRADLQHTRKFNMLKFLKSFEITVKVTGTKLNDFINVINKYKDQFNGLILDPVRLSYFKHALDEIGYYYLERGTIPYPIPTLNDLNEWLKPELLLKSPYLFYTKKELEKDPSLSPNQIFHSPFFTANLSGSDTGVQKQDVTEGTAKEDTNDNNVVPIPRDYIITRAVIRAHVANLSANGSLPEPQLR